MALFNKLKSQRGALFGMDARITLAIFSGLSVIAGTAGYGYMQQTQITSVSTELDNISKAYTNFMLDTSVNTNTFSDLLNNDGGQLGWSGPYMHMSSERHVSFGIYSLEYGIEMRKVKGTTPRPCINPRDLCFVWLKLSDVPAVLASSVDEHLDGAIDEKGSPDSGRLLVDIDQAIDKANIYYRISRK
ncbi:MAG: hypothetical protein ACI9TY_001830 [Alphaproteobacteria bacterium]|jgi:hypothetical protein